MTGIVIARALHVVAVVIWIGGVWMATTVALPAIRRGALGRDWLAAFHAFERRFAWHARVAVLVVGLTGLYVTWQLDLWDRFGSAAFWWMHAMVCLWLLFAIILFVMEPFVLHRLIAARAAADPGPVFAWLHRAHWILLVLGIVTVFGAVAGSQGWSIF